MDTFGFSDSVGAVSSKLTYVIGMRLKKEAGNASISVMKMTKPTWSVLAPHLRVRLISKESEITLDRDAGTVIYLQKDEVFTDEENKK